MLRRKQRSCLFCLLWSVLVLCLSGCFEQRLPEGVLATVNGVPLHLRTVQAYIDGKILGFGAETKPTVEHIRRLYGENLSVLIVQELARQALRKEGITNLAEYTATLEREIAEDYGDYGFERVMAEEGLDIRDWRTLLEGFAALQLLEEKILAPALEVSSAEVQQFYTAHAASFRLPEYFSLCFAASASEEALADWRRRFAEGKGRSSSQEILVRCSDVSKEQLPSSLAKAIVSLNKGETTRPRTENGMLTSVGLHARHAAEQLGPAAVYALIERQLRDQKRTAALNAWLEKTLKEAKIEVAPLLREALERRGKGEVAQQDTTNPSAPASAVATPQEANVPPSETP